MRASRAPFALALCLLSYAIPDSAVAAGTLPTGGNFAAGSGKISGTASTLTVNQTTKNGIINWTGFSIGQGNSVQINNGSGATLNRVTGTSPSTIAGSLTSTGSTFLVNQNGVVVTPSGQVVTGGSFVGSTRDTSNSAFMGGAGNLEFTGTSSGTVTNQGSISAGGDAVLIGKSVTNSGSISAPNGTAGAAAGDDVVLTPANSGLQIQVKTGSGDATTSGNIAAAQAAIDAAGGNVYALSGNNGGVVRATGTQTINGHVWLTAPNGTAQVTGTIAAKNADGSGGAIDVQGSAIDVSGTLDASDVVPAGNGGSITVGSPNVASTNVSGTILARGGAEGGNGGKVETSGAVLNIHGATVDTRAPNGATGNWTLDPTDVTICAAPCATGNESFGSGAYTPSGDTSQILNTDLQGQLATTNVTVSTSSSGSGTGTITVNAPLTWSANVLTLDAYLSIAVNAPLTPTGTAGLALKTNDGGSGGDFYFAAGGNITFANASEALTINGVTYTLESTLAGLASAIASSPSGHYALANSIDASSVVGFEITTTFTGTFEGLGNTISNLVVSASDAGLFETIGSGGTVRDLGIVGGSFFGFLSAGPLAETNTGTVENDYATASVNTSRFDAGGLVSNNHGTIENSYATGTVITAGGGEAAGGLVGSNYGTITNSYATGAVGTPGIVGAFGGLIGVNNGIATNSYATGPVSGALGTIQSPSGIGGLVGYALSTLLTGDYFDTQTTGQSVATGNLALPGMGLTTAQLQGTLPSGYSSSVWGTGTGLYPYLRRQFTSTPQVISGVAYSDQGLTPLGTATVTALVNGSNAGSVTTGANGYYYLAVAPGTIPSSNGQVLTYLSQGALLETGAHGSATGNSLADNANGSVSGLDIYGSTLIVSNAGATLSGVVADLNTALGSNSGSAFLFNSGPALSLNSGANLDIASTASSLTLDQPITTSGAVSLNLTSNGSIIVGAGNGISSTSGPLSVNLSSNLLDGGGYVDIEAAISTNGGSIVIGGQGSPLTSPAVGTASQPVGVIINSTLNSGGGAITINGSGYANGGSGAYGIEQVAAISSGGGNITLAGTGGGTGANSIGYAGIGSGATISANGTASGGNISITGNGGPNGTSSNDSGIVMSGAISTNFAGTITLTGSGGGTGAMSGSSAVDLGARLSAVDGNVSIAGSLTVAGTGNSSDYGVYLSNHGGAVSITGSGGLTINGTLNGSGQSGVYLDASSTISGNGSAISITGIGGTSGAIDVILGSSIANPGNITLIGDTMSLGSLIGSAGSTVTVEPLSASRPVDAGSANDPGNDLYLSAEAVTFISAANLVIGNSTDTGVLTVAGGILELPNVTNLSLVTGTGNISVLAILMMPASSTLTLNSGGTVTANEITPRSGTISLALAGSGNFTLTSPLTKIANVSGTAGSLTLDDTAPLTVGNLSITKSAGLTLTDTASSGTALTLNGAVSSGAGPITLLADTISLGNSITAPGQTVTLEPNTTSLNITVGGTSDPGSDFYFSTASLNQISAATLVVGGSNGTGGVTVNAPLNANPGGVLQNVTNLTLSVGSGNISIANSITMPNGTLTLSTSGNVTQAAATTITASGLVLSGGSGSSFTLTNAGDNFASVTAGADQLLLNDAATGSLTVGGIRASGSAASSVDLAAAGSITVSGPIGGSGSLPVTLDADTGGNGGYVDIEAGINTHGNSLIIGGGANPATSPAVGTASHPAGVTINGILSATPMTITGEGYSGGSGTAYGVNILKEVGEFCGCSNPGPITITGYGGGGNSPGINQASSALAMISNQGNITLAADSMSLAGTVRSIEISSGTGILTLEPTTAGRPIAIGGSSDPNAGNDLFLSTADLNTIASNGGGFVPVVIGSASGTGGLTVSAALTNATNGALAGVGNLTLSQGNGAITISNSISLEASSTLTLNSAAGVTQAASAAITGTTASLVLSGGSSFALNAAGNSIANLSGSVGSLNFTDGARLTVTASGLSGSGAITLTDSNANGITISGTLASSGNITLVANAMSIGAAVNSSGQTVTLQADTASQAVNVGGTPAGGLALSGVALSEITAANLVVGSSGDTGTLTVTGALSNTSGLQNVTNLSLVTGSGAISIANGITMPASGTLTLTSNSSSPGVTQSAVITASNLVLSGSGVFTLQNSGNNIASVSANVDQLNLTDAATGSLIINGISAFGASSVNLAAAGNITVTGAITDPTSNGSLAVTLDADTGGAGGYVDIEAAINTHGNSITIGGGANPATSPAVGTASNPSGVTINASLTGNATIINGQGYSGGSGTAYGVNILQGTVGSGDSGNTATPVSITGIGGGGNSPGIVQAAAATISTWGNVTLTADSMSLAGVVFVDSRGGMSVILQPLTTSLSVAIGGTTDPSLGNDLFLSSASLSEVGVGHGSNLVIGNTSDSGTLTVSSALSLGNALTLSLVTGTGNISIANALGVAGNTTLTLNSGGSVTQNAAITPTFSSISLVLAGGGSFALNSSSNNIANVSGSFGSLTLSDSAALKVTSGGLSGTGAITLTDSNSGGITIGGNLSSGGNISVAGGGGVSIASAVSAAGTLTVSSTNGNIVLNSGASLSAAASGDALIIEAGANEPAATTAGGDFVNNAGASVFSTPHGNWLVYTGDTVENGTVTGGLTDTAVFDVGTSFTPTVGANYILFRAAQVSVIAALTGSVSKVYDSTTAATLGAANYTLTGVAAVDQGTVALTVNATPITNPTFGSYSAKDAGNNLLITVSGLGLTQPDNDPYVLAATVIHANIGAITPAVLTISAVSDSRIYNGTTSSSQTPAYQVANEPANTLYGSDTLAGVTQAFASKNVLGAGGSTLVVAGYSVNDGNSGNDYTVTLNTASGTISPASLTISAVSDSRVYNGTTSSSQTPTVSGLFSPDTVTNLSQAFSSKDVLGANGSTLAVTGYSVNDGNGGNDYTVTLNMAPGTINPAALTISAVTDSRIYNGTTSSSQTPTVSGLFSPDTVTNLSQAYTSKDVLGADGSTLAVTGYSVNDGNGGNDYTVTLNTAPGTINPAALTISAASDSRVYNGTTSSSQTPTVSGLFSPDTVTNLAQAFTSKDVLGANGSTLAVTGYSVNDGNSGNDYTVTLNTASGTISPASLTISAVSDSRVYNGTTSSSQTPTVSGLFSPDTVTNLAQAFASKNVLGANGSTLAVTGYSVNDGNSGRDYSVTLSTAPGTISPASLTISAVSDSRVYNGTTSSSQTPTVSGLFSPDSVTNLSQAYTSKDVLGANGSALAVTGYSVNDGNGGNDYTVTLNTAPGTINPAALTISAASDSRVYNGTTSSSQTPTVSGLFSPDTVTNLSQAFNSKDVLGAGGSTLAVAGYVVNDGNDGNDYAVTLNTAPGSINPATLTISAVSDSRVYNGTTSSSQTPTVSGLFSPDTVTNLAQAFTSKDVPGVSGSTLAVTGYSVNDGNGGNDYTVTLNTAPGTINPAALTISATSDSRIYNGTTSSSQTPTVSGLFSPDSVTNLGQTFTAKDVLGAGGSTLAVTSYIVNDGNNGANYTVSTQAAKGTITPATLTVTANPETRVYGTSDPALNYVTGPFQTGDSATNVLTGNLARGSYGTLAGEQVGSYAINQGTLAANPDYSIQFTGSTLSITSATLTVIANPESKVYGTSDPALTYATFGLVNATVDGVAIDDSAATVLSGGLARTAGENVGSYAISQGSLAANGNYTLAFTGNTLAINPATLTITATGGTKVYDGTTASSLIPTYTGLVAGDSLTALTEAYNSKDVPTATTLSVSSYGLSDPSNYTVVTKTAPGTITPVALTVTAASQTKIYDGTRSATSVDPYSGATLSAVTPNITLGAIHGSDTITMSEAFTSANAGAAVLKPAVAINDGVGGADYAVTLVNASGTINQRPLALTGSRIYDGTTNASASILTMVNVIAGDTVTLTGAGVLTGNGLTNGNQTPGFASIGTLALGGTSASNYTLANITTPVFVGSQTLNTVYISFSGVNLTGGNSLSGANLSGLNLAGANLSGLNLTGTNLTGTNLAGANLGGANLKGATLTNADLANANLSGANLKGDNLAGANLSGADFAGANMSGEDLLNALLIGTNLSNANLKSSNLTDANLTGANLTGANLNGANLTGVTE